MKIIKSKKIISTLVAGAVLGLIACGGNPVAGTAEAAKVASSAQIDSKVPATVAKTITQTLETHYASQNLKVQSIRPTPIEGLYEVVVNGKQITYTDATGQYMLVGDLVATKEGRSLTEVRAAELNAISFNELPFDKAIKEVRGNGALKVAVFSDPDCPYCKRLEHDFAKMDNVTIYTFLMPIPSLHPDASRKSVQIWCQPNLTKTWTEWMRSGKMPPKVAECSNPIAETTALGGQFGFNGTPTLVYPNGKTQAGYTPMPHLEKIIQQNQQ